jgi:Leucine-rich repeat (LRR) protein
MIALEQLYLSENKLTNIDTLFRTCPNLKILDVASNRIESIKIESAHLRELWANDNRISALNDLCIDAPLTTIYLHGNSISKQSVHYKDKLKLMMPTLLQIDG